MAFDAATYKNTVLVPLAKDKAQLEVLQQVIRDLQGSGGINAAARLNAGELFAVDPGMAGPQLVSHLKSLEMTYNKQKNLPSAQLLKKLLDLFGKDKTGDPAFWAGLAASRGQALKGQLDEFAKAVAVEQPLRVVTPEQAAEHAKGMGLPGMPDADLARALAKRGVEVHPDFEIPKVPLPTAIRRATEYREFRTIVDVVLRPEQPSDIAVIDELAVGNPARVIVPEDIVVAQQLLRQQEGRVELGARRAAQNALHALSRLTSPSDLHALVLAAIADQAEDLVRRGLPRVSVRNELIRRGIRQTDAGRLVAKFAADAAGMAPGSSEPPDRQELVALHDELAQLTRRVAAMLDAWPPEPASEAVPTETPRAVAPAPHAPAPVSHAQEPGTPQVISQPATEDVPARTRVRESVYGIDLGTTYSAIARIDNLNTAEVILNLDAQPTTPSVVYFESDNNVVVGEEAKRTQLSDPDNACSFIKRQMGTVYPQEFRGKEYSPEGISALILKELVKSANNELGEEVSKVVITVPAYFGIQEKESTKQAGQIAGLEVVGIVTEPVAAALSLGIRGERPETLLVYDLGGGTFDTTIMRAEAGRIEVIAIDGNRTLGGADWDEALAQLITDKFVAQAGLGSDNPRDDGEFEIELLGQAEDTKKSLTKKESANVRCRYQGSDEQVTVTRTEFEAATRHLVAQTLEIGQRVVTAAKKKVPGLKVDRVLLVGGSSKMPMIEAALREQLGWEPVTTEFDLAVAKGAAIYGQPAVEARHSGCCPACEEFFGKGRSE
ncbi:MAG: Hsp70 family protein [Candidatus Nanopelagicales bacterium]